MKKSAAGIVSYGEALALLRQGEPVALPTETVYGLAGRIDFERTLKKIFALKRRPLFDPLIVHCRDREQARQYISGSCPLADSLWKRFAPGPLTVVVPKNSKISPLITAHQPTAAIRIPAHPMMRKILHDVSVPLAAPSANLFGKLSPTTAAHALSAFEGKIPVLDGGECQWGLESTIAAPDYKRKKLFILRPGAITKEELERFLREERSSFALIEKTKRLEKAPRKIPRKASRKARTIYGKTHEKKTEKTAGTNKTAERHSKAGPKIGPIVNPIVNPIVIPRVTSRVIHSPKVKTHGHKLIGPTLENSSKAETPFPEGAAYFPGSQKSHYAPDVPLALVESEKSDREVEGFLLSVLDEILPTESFSGNSKKKPIEGRLGEKNRKKTGETAGKTKGKNQADQRGKNLPKTPPKNQRTPQNQRANIKKLSLGADPLTAARCLYSDLRALSRDKRNIIYVRKAEAQKGELWEAIWDRLGKAASKKYKF